MSQNLDVFNSLHSASFFNYLMSIDFFLQTEGLYQSGYFLQRDLTFRRDRETMLKKELEQMVVPVKEFTFETRIWRPSNWVVTRRKRSRTGRLSDKTEVIPTVICQDGDEETQLPSRGGGAAGNNHVGADTEFVYEVQKTTLTKTCSNFGWRWRTFFHRTNSAMWNLIYWLGIVIPFVSKVYKLNYDINDYPIFVINTIYVLVRV